MSITRVSAATYGVTPVNFTGKSKEKSNNIHTPNIIKSVPVAALIALSPLNPVEVIAKPYIDNDQYVTNILKKSEGSTLENKTILSTRDFQFKDFRAKVNIVKDDRNFNVHKIWLDWEKAGERSGGGFIKALNHVNYLVTSQDKKPYGAIQFDNIVVEDFESDNDFTRTFSNPQLCKFIGELLKNYDMDIPENDVSVNIAPDSSGKLSEESASIDWHLQTREDVAARNDEERANKWGTFFSEWKVETDNGTYTIRAYDTNGNKYDYEQISIQKRGIPKMELEGLVHGKAKFATIDNKIGEMEMFQINLKDGPVIYNKELWMLLYKLLGTVENNGAIKGKNGHFRYDTTTEGKPIICEEN